MKEIARQRLRQLRSKSVALPLKCLNIWFHFARHNILLKIFLIFTWLILNEVGLPWKHISSQFSSSNVNVLGSASVEMYANSNSQDRLNNGT